MLAGNKAIDGGNLIFTDEGKEGFLKLEPRSLRFFKKFIGSEEFINNKSRWCLWLVGVEPSVLREMPYVLERIQNVRSLREKSPDVQARQLSNFPSTFRDKHNPKSALIIPLVSSERRKYIPMGFIDEHTVPSNLCSFISNASLFLFGTLSSQMHMAWVKHICGRLESRFRYSNSIVYNNYPFPLSPTESQKKKVEEAAQLVLDTRTKYPNSSLADLYDPITMPPDLVRAHQALDKAVDLCYRAQAFGTELSRIEFLFGLYEQYAAPMFGGEEKKKKR